MVQVYDIHTDLIGKISKLTEFGTLLEKQYENLFNIGNWHKARIVNYYCSLSGGCEMSLMFIDEKPVTIHGITLCCLKEVGKEVSADWHWYTLEQLVICN